MRIFCLLVLVMAAIAETDGPTKVRPVMKVVRLLQDMRQELQKEQEADQALFDKMFCWCQNTGKDKKAAIGKANAAQKALMASIDELTARSAQLDEEIKTTKKEVEENQLSLKQATEVRMEARTKFNEEDNASNEAIGSLNQAINVLSKHNPSNDVIKTDFLAVAKMLHKHMMTANKDIGHLWNRANSMIGMLQQPATGMKSYNSRSGQILGILEQMKERFEEMMSAGGQAEKKAQEEFEALKKAKETEIAAGYDAIESKTAEKANVDAANAQAKLDLEDNNAALAADIAFTADMEQKCKRTDAEFQERRKTRAEEMAAVGDAIKILNSDNAFANMNKTVNKAVADGGSNAIEAQDLGFLQLGSRRRSLRAAVVSVLEKAASNTGNPKLAELAVSAKLDAFTKVKKAIDDMIAALVNAQQDEVEQRDWCVSELNTNKEDNAVGEQTQNKLELKIEALTQEIEKLTKEIDELMKDNADTKESMAKAADNRAAANAEYQATISDQRETQQVLNRAMARLNQFYRPGTVLEGFNDKPAMSDGRMMFGGKLFSGTTEDGKVYKAGLEVGSEAAQNAAVGTVAELQKEEEDKTAPGAKAAPPPDGFDEFKKNEGGNRVLDMLEKVMNESKALEAQAMQDEKDQVTAYDEFVKDSNTLVKDNLKSIVDKTAARATADEDKVASEQDHSATMEDLEKLAKYNAELHTSCDFLLKNFELRQAAREQEKEALNQAKAILSGAQ